MAEVTQWLSETTEKFDLIIACDTFIYFGDLSPVLSLATNLLADDGFIAFSVERAESDGYRLTDNGRYVHHPSHVTHAAEQAGLKICAQRKDFIRMEYGSSVDASYVCLTRMPIPA